MGRETEIESTAGLPKLAIKTFSRATEVPNELSVVLSEEANVLTRYC